MPSANVSKLDELDRKLLNGFQHDFPLSCQPYLDIAEKLGVDEALVIERLTALKQQGVISRVGAVIKPNRVGKSLLAAMSVSAQRLTEIAALVSSYDEVNHNYEREHYYNLWFVVAAASAAALDKVLDEIEDVTGHSVLRLPLQQDYHIDLGFELKWQ